MHTCHNLRISKSKQVVCSTDLPVEVFESLPTELLFCELILLDGGSCSTVENEYPFLCHDIHRRSAESSSLERQGFHLVVSGRSGIGIPAFYLVDDSHHLLVGSHGLVDTDSVVGGFRLVGALLVFLYYAQCLLHLVLVVEIHLDMHSVATDIVEQRTQFVEGHPACHDAFSSCKNLLVEVIPLGRSALWLSHSRRPLYGVELFYLKQGWQMVHCPHTVEMIQRVVYLLTLLTDEGLHKASVILHADHRGDVALQLCHLSRCPR